MSATVDPPVMLVGLFLFALVLRLLIGVFRRLRLSARQRAYRAYLETETWKRLRREALERDGRRCRLCNAKGRLQVHHRYYPDVLGTETVDALTTLCGRCHDEVAHHSTRVVGWLPPFLGHLR